MARFFPGKTISNIHGTAVRQGDTVYFAMYHPAAALHQQSLRQAIEADMKKITSVLAEAESTPEDEPGPQQLSMF
jgi:DNA polymerase